MFQPLYFHSVARARNLRAACPSPPASNGAIGTNGRFRDGSIHLGMAWSGAKRALRTKKGKLEANILKHTLLTSKGDFLTTS